jgi:hypothetical protein
MALLLTAAIAAVGIAILVLLRNLEALCFGYLGFKLIREGVTDIGPFVHMSATPYGGGEFRSNGRWTQYQLNANGRYSPRYAPRVTVLEIEITPSVRFKLVPELQMSLGYRGSMQKSIDFHGAWVSGRLPNNDRFLRWANTAEARQVGVIARKGRLYVVRQGGIFLPAQARKFLEIAEHVYEMSVSET